MRRTVSWILILSAFIPLIMASNTLIPAIAGKVLWYRGVAFVVTAIFAFLLVYGPARAEIAERFQVILRKPLFWAVSGMIAAVSISTVFSFDKFIAFFGEPSRGEGFLTLFAMFAIYVVFVVLFQKNEWKKFFTATVLCSLVMFIWQMTQVEQGAGRSSAALGNAIFLAGYYLFSFLAAYYLTIDPDIRENRWLRWLGIVGMVISILGIFFTQTRGTILGLAVGGIVLCVVAMIAGKGKNIRSVSVRTIAVTILGFMVIGGGIFAATRHAAFWQSVPGISRIASGSTRTLDSRIIYLRIVKNGFVDESFSRKIVGWGWDNFLFFSNRYYDPAVYKLDSSGINRAHNKLADMLIMTGIIGLASYLAIWFFVIKIIVQKTKEHFALGLGIVFVMTSYFMHNLFAFDVPVTWFYFSAFLALFTQYEKK